MLETHVPTSTLGEYVSFHVLFNFCALDSRGGHFGNMQIKKNATTFIQCYHSEMYPRGPEDSKNVKTSQAYFLEGFI